MSHFENLSEKHWLGAILSKNGKKIQFLAQQGPILNFRQHGETAIIYKAKGSWEKSDVSL